MKIARFATGDDIRYGIVEGLSDDDRTPGPDSEGHLIVLKGDPLYTLPEATGEVVSLQDARLLSPVIPRSKVIGVGKNYNDPTAEVKAEAPRDPIIFLKPNTTVIGPDTPIVLPPWTSEVYYEGELAVVIKSMAKDISAADARRVILGYTVSNDVTARDVLASDVTWMRAKSFDTSCPLGPWIDIPEPGTDGGLGFDPDATMVRTRINGELVQEGNTCDMITGIDDLIAYVSSIVTLLPGDVLLTGTPVDVGEIRAGDRVEVEVEGLGRFSNPVVRR